MNRLEHGLNYFFLNKFLHPKPYPGYRQSIVLLIVNKNRAENENKFLFIKEKSGLWFFPKGHLIDRDLINSLFESISKNLENELGLRGIKIFDIKPSFTQKAYIFDFERQKYNRERESEEKLKGNAFKGKIYHLAIMHYKGTEEFKVDEKVKVLGHKWVSKDEAKKLLDEISGLVGNPSSFTEESHRFYKRFFEKILSTNEVLEKNRDNAAGSNQDRLL